MENREKRVIRIERDRPDHILPLDFYDILVQRFIPILGLTYVLSVFGVAIDKGDLLYYGFLDTTAYIVSLFFLLWISVPAFLWVFLRGSIMFCHIAEAWYMALSIVQVLLTTFIALLFPEADTYGMKAFFIELPVIFLLMYFLMVKFSLPRIAAYCLSMAGLMLLVYGSLINTLFGVSGS